MTLTYGIGTGASLCLAIWVMMLLHSILSFAIFPKSARLPKFLVLQYVFMLSVHHMSGLPSGCVPWVYARSIFRYLWFAIWWMCPKNFICFRVIKVQWWCVCVLVFVAFYDSWCYLSNHVTPMIFGRHIISKTKRQNSSFFQSPSCGPI